jgi:hypothetical protein
MVTDQPAARVQASLASLRPIADEIVIAADGRVDAETLAGYGAVADQLFRIEFRTLERHLPWLHAQCRGDWILRMDADEVPSARLIARLPDLLRTRTIDQYHIAQAWLYPDERHFLDDAPWAGDFPNRLVRATGGLHFDGRLHQHATISGPSAYVTEPTYHLSLVFQNGSERRAKAIRYEVDEPHTQAVGGRFNEAYYLPELRDALAVRDVPIEDRDCIARAVRCGPARLADVAPEMEVLMAAETSRYWAGREVAPTAYRARIAAFDRHSHSLVAGERRRMYILVTNEGDERWPWSLEHRPAIRLSYHWLAPDGSMKIHDGLRTALPATVEPGDTVLAPLDVLAPEQPGDHVLEVDLIHEDVRWFGSSCRIPVRVSTSSGLPPLGTRLRETRVPVLTRLRRGRIPHALHRVWLGEAEMPRRYRAYGDTFSEHHPGWEIRLWTDADLPALDVGETERARARSSSELSNLVRYEILSRHGGIYVDTDVECRRCFEPLLRGSDAFAGLELPGRVGNAVLGSVPGHRAFTRAAHECRETLGLGAHSPDANGPYFLSLILEQEPGVRILEQSAFYPYLWTEPERSGDSFPRAYAVHHWAASWKASKDDRHDLS